MDEDRIYKVLNSDTEEDILIGLHICKANHPKDSNWLNMVKRLFEERHGDRVNHKVWTKVLRIYHLGIKNIDYQ